MFAQSIDLRLGAADRLKWGRILDELDPGDLGQHFGDVAAVAREHFLIGEKYLC
jgi:hypothetical protein